MIMNGWREVPGRAAPDARTSTSTSCRKRARCRPRGRYSVPICVISIATGSGSVYGQIVTFESRRGEKMFERYGFKVINRARITKYESFHPESVYLSTVIKKLETAEPLSAYTNSST